jgi:hypothetical protein
MAQLQSAAATGADQVAMIRSLAMTRPLATLKSEQARRKHEARRKSFNACWRCRGKNLLCLRVELSLTNKLIYTCVARISRTPVYKYKSPAHARRGRTPGGATPTPDRLLFYSLVLWRPGRRLTAKLSQRRRRVFSEPRRIKMARFPWLRRQIDTIQ